MAWYWWVIIVIAVIVIGWLKLSVFKKIMEKRKNNQKPLEED